MTKKIILAVLVLILVGGIAAVFITDRVEQQSVRLAETKAESAEQEAQLDENLKTTDLRLIETVIGPLARDEANAKCYGKPASCVEALKSYKKAVAAR